jgi:transcription elongation GreA/GreB family factor
MKNIELKSLLLNECFRIVEMRHQRIKQSIFGIEESLFEESKSSAGDKHETGRAMLQIERENAGKQLREVENTLQALKRIDVNSNSKVVHLGSLVLTTQQAYFISVSAGILEISPKKYLAVSPLSPIGQLLIGKTEGEKLNFNGTEFQITNIK